MPTASFNKFNAFTAAVANKVHNLAADTLTIALSATAPTAANAVLSDIAQITYGTTTVDARCRGDFIDTKQRPL